MASCGVQNIDAIEDQCYQIVLRLRARAACWTYTPCAHRSKLATGRALAREEAQLEACRTLLLQLGHD